jgi:hypothetical protein
MNFTQKVSKFNTEENVWELFEIPLDGSAFVAPAILSTIGLTVIVSLLCLFS